MTVHIATPTTDQHREFCKEVMHAVHAVGAKLSGILVLDVVRDEADAQIRVTFGTSFVSKKAKKKEYRNYVANVAIRPNDGTPIVCDGQGGIGTHPVYLNVGHTYQPCIITREIVIHEFGHALGLERHFPGFGFGPPISPRFWDALATLYANPPATAFNKLNVVHLP